MCSHNYQDAREKPWGHSHADMASAVLHGQNYWCDSGSWWQMYQHVIYRPVLVSYCETDCGRPHRGQTRCQICVSEGQRCGAFSGSQWRQCRCCSIRGKIFEKKKNQQDHERRRPIYVPWSHFRCCRPVSPAYAIPQVQRNTDHDAIRDLPDGAYGYPGSSKWNFAGIDAVVQPDLLYQITVSQKHGINTHSLVTAAKNLCAGAANARLVFAVPPTTSSHNHGVQHATAIRNRPDLTSLARSVKQFLMEIPIQRYARSQTAAADAAMGFCNHGGIGKALHDWWSIAQ